MKILARDWFKCANFRIIKINSSLNAILSVRYCTDLLLKVFVKVLLNLENFDEDELS